MNLLDSKKIIKKGGLALCTALLFLFSCEDDATLGLPFDPDGENIGIFEKELILPYSAILVDSVNTSRPRTNTRSRILAGAYQNGSFGNVAATSFTNFSRTSTAIPSDATYDSAVLVLSADYWYGLTSSPATSGLSVHLLQEPLIKEGRIDTLTNGTLDTVYTLITYYSKDKVPYDANPIGQSAFSIDPKKDKNEVHVMLNDDFGTNLFTKFKDKDTIVSNNEKLQLYFNGIALVGADGLHNMLGFNPEETKIHLYHHTPTKDSLRYTLDTSASNWFSNYEADRSGTPLAGLTVPYQDFDPGNGNVYLQAGTGVVPKIDFTPFIDFIKSTGKNVVINQAEFSVEIDFPGEFLPAPASLNPYLVKDDNRLIYVTDARGTVSIKTIYEDFSPSTALVLRPDPVEARDS